MIRTLCKLLIVTQLAACATAPANVNQARYPAAVGDAVMATLRNGAQVSLQVTRIDANEICDGARCFALADVESIRYRNDASAPGMQTAMWIGVIVALAIAVAAGAGKKSGCMSPNPYNLPPGAAFFC